jgi:hypothetical protein
LRFALAIQARRRRQFQLSKRLGATSLSHPNAFSYSRNSIAGAVPRAWRRPINRRKNQSSAVSAELVAHLAGQLQRADPKIRDGASLLEQVRAADLAAYLWLTREALAVAEWYARLSQSELAVDRGMEGAHHDPQ